ncbi:MAG: hypothetical protein AAE985_06440 [Thermoplasmataceae archaeon]|jgi:hypothetical protein
MTSYQGKLINALELLLYQNRSREILSSRDEDVLQIFSGDVGVAVHGLHDFVSKHQEKATIIIDKPGIFEIRVFFMYPDLSQTAQRERYVENRHRRFGR